MTKQISATKILAQLMINRAVLIHLIKEKDLVEEVKESLGTVEAWAFVIGADGGEVEYAVPELNRYLTEAARECLNKSTCGGLR